MKNSVMGRLLLGGILAFVTGAVSIFLGQEPTDVLIVGIYMITFANLLKD